MRRRECGALESREEGRVRGKANEINQLHVSTPTIDRQRTRGWAGAGEKEKKQGRRKKKGGCHTQR
eukprot:scaffold3335_cov30-Tisochrysis_lutea.AAC.2